MSWSSDFSGPSYVFFNLWFFKFNTQRYDAQQFDELTNIRWRHFLQPKESPNFYFWIHCITRYMVNKSFFKVTNIIHGSLCHQRLMTFFTVHWIVRRVRTYGSFFAPSINSSKDNLRSELLSIFLNMEVVISLGSFRLGYSQLELVFSKA